MSLVRVVVMVVMAELRDRALSTAFHPGLSVSSRAVLYLQSTTQNGWRIIFYSNHEARVHTIKHPCFDGGSTAEERKITMTPNEGSPLIVNNVTS